MSSCPLPRSILSQKLADRGTRRRREVGQLSKGAIRAQRAQARAKQLRQNLLGSNLLSMSMYNAQAQNQRASIMPHHPGAQYAMAESYLPMGYDLDGRPNMQSAYPVQEGMYAPGPGGMVEGEMYRLPPIDHGMMQLGYDGMDWDPETGEYYPEGPSHPYETHPQEEYYPQGGAGYNFTDPAPGSEYRLPPLEASRETGHTVEMGDNTRLEDEGVDPRMRDWAKDGLQTPSGHVQFNARLFDGALGSAGLQHESRDAGLSGFDEAITQANEVQPW